MAPPRSLTTTFALRRAAWTGHRAGQHVDIRLTAEDGYQAERSYSIASAPEDESLVLTVERLDDGEVSPYLVDELRPGDQLELRGPIGGYFVWEPGVGGPLLLVGEHDLRYVHENCTYAARTIPGARLVELPGVAHLPHLENDERTLAEIATFVGSV